MTSLASAETALPRHVVYSDEGEWILALIVKDLSDDENLAYRLRSVKVLSSDTRALHPGREWSCWKKRSYGGIWCLYDIHDPMILESYWAGLEAAGFLPEPMRVCWLNHDEIGRLEAALQPEASPLEADLLRWTQFHAARPPEDAPNDPETLQAIERLAADLTAVAELAAARAAEDDGASRSRFDVGLWELVQQHALGEAPLREREYDFAPASKELP